MSFAYLQQSVRCVVVTGGVAASGGSFSSAVGPPRLTYPGSGSGDPAELAALPSEEAEADVLPFALDADAMPASPHPPVPLRMSLGGTPSPPGALSRGPSSLSRACARLHGPEEGDMAITV